MANAASIPAWLAIMLAVGAPVLTFFGVLWANNRSRRTAVEAETRSKREETMRNLRWAAELALSDEPKRALLGLMQLEALEEADMLDDQQKVFVTAALEAVVAPAAADIDEAEESGEDVVVVAEGSGVGTTSWHGRAEGSSTALESESRPEQSEDLDG